MINSQYSGPDPFGGPGGYGSTGAAGSASAVAESAGGATLATVTVTTPGSSSQIPQPQLSVQAGDTSAFSTDAPIPLSGDPLSGLSFAQVTQTGAGEGSGHTVHPNSMARRPR